MQHFLVEFKAWSDLTTAYPHSPENLPQSLQDYLEDKLSEGFEIVTRTWYSTSYMEVVFKVVGK